VRSTNQVSAREDHHLVRGNGGATQYAAMPTRRSNRGVIDKQLIHCRPALRLAGRGCAAGSLDRGI